MGIIRADQVKNKNIKYFIDKNPDIDIISYDFHNTEALSALGAGDAAASPPSAGVDQTTLTSLRTFQRTLRLTGSVTTAEGLADSPYTSAAAIAAVSPTRFVAETKAVFGDDEAAARAVHERAGHIKTAALQLYGSIKDLVASPFYARAAFNSVDPDVVDYFTQIPSYTSLFGNMNYFETDPGQTIFSPAAYYFDMMRIVDEYVTYPNTTPVRTIPRGYTLEERRPDLFALKLTPANTFDEEASLTLINEVLAFSIQARGSGEAYPYLALASYPFNLPFNRPLLALRQSLVTLGVPLAEIYRDLVVDRDDPATVQPLDLARETLALSVTDLDRFTQADASVAAVSRAYGYDIPYTPPPFPGDGLIGTVAGSPAVVGAGTRFEEEIAVGDSVTVDAVSRVVTAIADDTALTVAEDWTETTASAYTVIPSSEPPAPFQGQGTIAISPDSTTVEGTGTDFVAQVTVGDEITAAGQTRMVTLVTSATRLEVGEPWPYISTGLDYTITPQAQAQEPYAGAGGVVFVAGETTVTGIGTAFATDYADGGAIKVGEVTATVATVASDTSLTVTAAWVADAGTGYTITPTERTLDVLEVLPKAGQGTVTFSKTSTTLVGTGTDFVAELRVSDQITAGGETRTITEILSPIEARLDLAPTVDADGLSYTILKMDGLDLVTVFLDRTGLTAEGLTSLLRQNLDDAELEAGGADGFFINDTGETPAAVATYFCNDPGNPTQRLSGLTLKRLDRISRFVRTARLVGWSYADLQWAMTATGATELTDALVMDLGRIATLMAGEGLEVTDVTALFHALKTSGRVDAANPRDQFDRIYNPPALLQGEDPYRAGSTTPFDPYRDPAQVWQIAVMDGEDGIIRNRLRAALTINDVDLTRLATYVQSLTGAATPDQVSLTLSNLSWLWRLAATARRLGWTVDDYLTFLGLVYYPSATDYFRPPQGAVTFALDGLEAQFQLARWVSDSDFGVPEIQYIVTGASPKFSAPYAVDGIPAFLADLSTAAQSTHLTATTLAVLQIDTAQAAALFDKLVALDFVTASGVALRYLFAYDDVAALLPVRVTGEATVFGFDEASFVSPGNGITADQSRQVYQALLESAPPILIAQPGGTAAVAETYTEQTDLSFLAPIFPTETTARIEAVRLVLVAARDGLDGLLGVLGQTVSLQQTALARGLGDFVGATPQAVASLLPFAAAEAALPDYLDAFLTPLPPDTEPSQAVEDFIAIIARAGLVVDTCRLDLVETAYITSPEGAPHFNIADWTSFGITDLASISAYAALRDAVGARRNELIAYFRTPSDDKAKKAAALAEATGWDVGDIAVLDAYFWPTPSATDADTVAGLSRLSVVFDLERRLGVGASMLTTTLISTSHLAIETAAGTLDEAHWATYESVAETVLGIVNARFTGTALDDANHVVEEAVNGGSRDALVGNVLWWKNARDPAIRSVNDLYKYLLLDVQVGTCATTSRIAQAIASIQLYLQRARMMLEPGVLRIEIPAIWWTWMSAYRMWEVNRKIFLYPENYIEPSLRQDTTPQFRDLADELLQNDPTKANVEPPFSTFINQLTVLGALRPVGAYQTRREDQKTGEEKDTLFLIGRTQTEPYQFYFRALDNAVEWNPWYPIDLTISGSHLSPVHAFGRLFVFWIEFDTGKSNSIANETSNTETVDKASLKYAFYNNGAWSSVQTLDPEALINTYPSSYPTISDPGVVSDLLRKENSYWQFPYVVSTGKGLVGAGRVSLSAGLGVVTGDHQTQFEREVRAGDSIICFGETRVVGSVADDQTLVVTEPWTGSVSSAEYKIIPLSREDRFRSFAGTGKVYVTKDAPLVSGEGTRFQDEFVYGDSITVGNESYLVIQIQDQTNLLVDQNWLSSHSNVDYIVVPGRQGDENILVCYSPPVETQAEVAFGSKVTTSNPTKNNFITAQNALNTSVYNGLWLASQYWPGVQDVPGAVPLSNCLFLDDDLTRSNRKILFTDYAYAAAANPQPYRAHLLRQYARLTVSPSRNVLADNYWGTNLPYQFDSERRPAANDGIDLLFNIARDDASLLPVANKPGAFVYDNVDEAFLVRPDAAAINLISDSILRSRRPWKPNLETSEIFSTGAYTAKAKPLEETDFTFTRLTTDVMPTLQSRLFAGGIDRLLSLSSQYLPELPFNRFYPPPNTTPPPHVIPVGSPLMDFNGSFGLYFWEIFFHGPFLIADRLQGNGKFEEALAWLHYIFNPTEPPSSEDAPDSTTRFWRFRPFREMDQPSLRTVLTDPRQIRRYNYDPFDPDAIAAIRPVAYAKAIVMRYVDVVLDWADSLFTQYTRESITQATNLYVFAQDLLGEKPQSLGKLPLPEPKSFNDLKAEYPTNQIPQFLIDLENTPVLHPTDDNARYPSQPVNDIVAYFAVPENADFMAYWDRVDDRLFKIRHCMNIDGKVVPLALFAPPIDPALLLQAMAGGGAALSQAFGEAVPYYRFSYLVERAQAMTGQLAGLNAALLSALEKKDAEALNLLTSEQESVLLKLTTMIKEQEIADAEVTGEALQESLASAEYRQAHYADLLKNGISVLEQTSLDAMLAALAFNVLGTVTKTAASIGYAVPQVGSPFAMTYGGQQIGNALNAASGVFEIGAAISNFVSQQSQTLAAYDRRDEDWTLQEKLAGYDVAQITDQIQSNAIRVAIAKQNLVVHEETIRQNQERTKFLKDKFTNEDLYQWMANQVARVQYQAYTLAYQLALTAQRAYQFEYNSSRNFVSFDYWNAAHRGLGSSEGLQLALSQMQASTLDVSRSLEIERTISLMQIDPTALIQLRETGECFFEFSERLFDFDFPGHYNRKIKTVTVSIPTVIGPYQNIKATLTQLSNYVVLTAGDAGLNAVSFLLGSDTARTPPADVMRSNWRNGQEIVLSSGQDDSGMFNPNLEDSRYLPFEGTGAVSSWRLRMPKGTNRIPFDSISDVIVTVKYIAIDGGEAFRSKVVGLDPLKAFTGVSYVDCRSMYFDAWQLFFESVTPQATTQTLSLPITDVVPPNVDRATLTGFYILLSADASVPGDYISVKLTDSLTADVSLSAVNDMLYRFDQHGQTPPAVDKVTAKPVEIRFDLAKTPVALKRPDQTGLSPDALKDIQIVFYYAGKVDL